MEMGCVNMFFSCHSTLTWVYPETDPLKELWRNKGASTVHNYTTVALTTISPFPLPAPCRCNHLLLSAFMSSTFLDSS